MEPRQIRSLPQQRTPSSASTHSHSEPHESIRTPSRQRSLQDEISRTRESDYTTHSASQSLSHSTSHPASSQSASYGPKVNSNERRSRHASSASQSRTDDTYDDEDSYLPSEVDELYDDGTMRYFVALYTYDPYDDSPNKDAADEELAFREGDVIKVRRIYSSIHQVSYGIKYIMIGRRDSITDPM